MRATCEASRSMQTYDSAIISLKDLQSIKCASQIITPVTAQEEQKFKEYQTMKANAASHRDRIKSFIRSQKPAATPLNLSSVDDGQETTWTRAQKLLDEE